MTLVEFTFNRFKSLLLVFVRLFWRAMCCIRRKRRPSFDLNEDVDIITYDNNGVRTNPKPNPIEDLESWNNWDDNTSHQRNHPNTIQEHIEQYRQQATMKNVDVEEQLPDFFEDMTPKITSQVKILIASDNEKDSYTNKLSLNLQPENQVKDNSLGELGEWEEQRGWEEETSGDWNNIQSDLKTKRKLERESRRQQKLTSAVPQTFAAKVFN